MKYDTWKLPDFNAGLNKWVARIKTSTMFIISNKRIKMDIFDEFFEDTELMGHQYTTSDDITVDWSGYYGQMDYTRFDPMFDETLDFIVALPETGDLK